MELAILLMFGGCFGTMRLSEISVSESQSQDFFLYSSYAIKSKYTCCLTFFALQNIESEARQGKHCSRNVWDVASLRGSDPRIAPLRSIHGTSPGANVCEIGFHIIVLLNH
jgi:hypothetical protein